MFTIHTYTDTKCELEIAKTRLNFLMDKKETLYCKYFPLTSNPEEVTVDGGEQNKDRMPDYLHELHEVDLGTGMSLAQEIEYQQKKIDKSQNFLDTMTDTLSKMQGIEYQLYYEIAFNGMGISKAVDKVAERNDKDTRTIWKNYYKNIKKDIKKLKTYHS